VEEEKDLVPVLELGLELALDWEWLRGKTSYWLSDYMDTHLLLTFHLFLIIKSRNAFRSLQPSNMQID